MKHYAIIPARYASTRFPGKPLAKLWGKPIIQHVHNNALSTNLFDEVIIATDDERIAGVAKGFGAVVVMTDPKLASGTDRIAKVAESLDRGSIILNIQGDEPLISKEPLQKLLNVFADESVKMASLYTFFKSAEEAKNPNMVKLVLDNKSDALYFSRSPIPFDRDGKASVQYLRHIGVYAFRHQTLMDFVSLLPSPLEEIEKLEQLRAIENGIPIRMVFSDYQGVGIDTPQDLSAVERMK